MNENSAEAGGAATTETPPRSEEHKVRGEKVIEKIKQLLHEGNVRRLIIKNEEGRTLIEVPLSVGVVGALVAPVWAAIGAVAALVKDCSIEVERQPSGE